MKLDRARRTTIDRNPTSERPSTWRNSTSLFGNYPISALRHAVLESHMPLLPLTLSSGLQTARFLTALLTCIALSAGCTTTRSVSAREIADFSRFVRVGDSVEGVLRDGTRKAFRVTQVEPRTVSGKDGTFTLSDLAELSVERVSVGKTTLLVIGGVVVVAAVAFAASPSIETPFHAAGQPR